ncbi:response regulator [Bacteroides sp. 214]|uniref:ATP-binding response regulator n=1 Tax=Bacteroides sp. 214 TaxID=2302935 RepID=UPI0013D8481E|nr:ATP-binding protein [Bacteroides sp. 214]NDW12847.1 response regulator [Bacteroides sp. 214]
MFLTKNFCCIFVREIRTYIPMIIAFATTILLLIVSVIAILLEMQKRKRLQELLKKRAKRNQFSSQLFDAVFQNVNAYLFLIDRDLAIVKSNSIDSQNAQRITLNDLLRCSVNSQDKEKCNCGNCILSRRVTLALLEQKEFSLTENIILNLPNSTLQFDALITGSYIDIDNERFIVITLINLAETNGGKESKVLAETLQVATTISSIGVASINLSTGKEFATPLFYKNLFVGDKESVNVLLQKLPNVESEDKKALLACIESVRKGDMNRIESRDVQIVISEEKSTWVRFICQKRESTEEKQPELIVLVIDVNQEKNNELFLKEEKEKAEDADRSKSAFLADMSHEIRTPLNAIVGFSELLAAATSGEEKGEYLGIIKNSSDMLLQLINDILDMSKIEAGVIEFNYGNVNVNSLIDDLSNTFRLRLARNKPNVKYVSELGLPALVLNTDKNRLGQVLSNFVSNAIKFTEKGSITLGYKVREDGIYFYVKDTGMGMDEEARKKLFGRFNRFHKTMKGNGLGLAISKTIIERLNGTIGADSVQGEGSTFWFVLPLDAMVDVQTVARTLQVEKKESTGSEIVNNKKPLILIAEYSDECRRFEAVLAEDYQVIWAQTGEEAVTKFLVEQPELTLLNLVLPDVNGFQVMEAIAQMSAGSPIIAIGEKEEEKEPALQSGFVDFILKPISGDTLIDKVASYIKK